MAKPVSEVMDLTPELAQQWLDGQCNSGRLDLNKVKLYAGAMKQGKWKPVSIVDFNVAKQMINGQHRCAAVVMSGVRIKVLVRYQIQEVK